MSFNDPGSTNPFTYLMREAFDSVMRTMMVCLPGKVLTFDPEEQTAQIECGIQKVVNGQGITIAPIIRVPVHFSGNDEWYFFHEVTPGTEGLIHFSQRAIDLWLDRGGPVKPHDLRMFSADDAFFVPGLRSRPGKITGFTNEGAGISNYTGDVKIHLTDGKITMTAATIESNGEAIHNGNQTNNGNIDVTGDVAADGDVTAGSISLTNHTHPINSGSSAPGPTGAPT